MKRLKLFSLCAAALLLLAACGGKAAAPFDPAKATQALLDSSAFSVSLEELDASLLYDFQGYGLSEDAITASASYSASGLTEQVSVLVCKDADAAQQVLSLLEDYLADAKETYRNYAPAELPKLDSAILEQRHTSILLVVAADSDAARAAVDGL